jgi:hypothetical protein
VTWENIGAVKTALLRALQPQGALQPQASAMLLDPGYALPIASRPERNARGDARRDRIIRSGITDSAA